MADCLKSNLSVQEPIYCEDSSGNIISDTAMYSWMSVRAAGPNVLKDTTLCGTTRIIDGSLEAPDQCYFQVYLEDPLGVNMGTNMDAPINFYPFGNGNYATRPWTVTYQGTQSNESLNIFGLASFSGDPIAPVGSLAIQNVSGKNIVVRLTLTATINHLAQPAASTQLVQVGLWESEVSATPLPSNASIQGNQTSLPAAPSDPTVQEITCDYITIMKPDSIVQPVIAVASAIPVIPIASVNFVAKFIEYFQAEPGVDLELPGGQILPAAPG